MSVILNSCSSDKNFIQKYKSDHLVQFQYDSVNVEAMILKNEYWEYLARTTGRKSTRNTVLQLKIQDNRAERRRNRLAIQQKFSLEANIVNGVKLFCGSENFTVKTCFLEFIQEQFVFDSYLIEFDQKVFDCNDVLQLDFDDRLYQIKTSININ